MELRREWVSGWGGWVSGVRVRVGERGVGESR